MTHRFRELFLALILAFAIGMALGFQYKYGYDAQPTSPDTTHEHVWCFEDECLIWRAK